jgi:hypothetical protein
MTRAVQTALAGSGGVLQVVQGSYSTGSSSTSASYVDTGLSASITPSSTSSKILVLVTQSVFIAGSSQGQGAVLGIFRDSTLVWESINQAVQSYDQGGSGVEVGASIGLNYLDSPSTTSTLTYKTRVYRSGGAETRWRAGTITLVEIAG